MISNIIYNSTVAITAPSLTSSQQEILKHIAIISMILAHFAGVFIHDDTLFYSIGRVAMPLFSFLMVYSYIHHTSSPVNYILRILAIACVAEYPFHSLLGTADVYMANIMFTLSSGLLIIYIFDKILQSKNALYKYSMGYGSIVFFVIAGLFVDYIHLGLALIIIYWVWLKFPSHTTLYIAGGATFLLNIPSGLAIALSGALAFAIIGIVMGINLKIKRINKWYFYIFYPAHLVALLILQNYFT